MAPCPDPFEFKLLQSAPAVFAEVAGATGGRFGNAGGVLAFLSAVAEARLAATARCRRGPAGHWWAEVEAPWQAVAQLIWMAGGQPFTRQGDRWTAAPAPGMPAASAEEEWLVLAEWEAAGPVELLAAVPLQARRPGSASSLSIIVPGPLGRWVLRRALALGLRVGIVPALRRPLQEKGPESGVLLLRLRAEQGNVPLSLVRALGNLPYTLVAQAATAEGKLLLDSRLRLPLATTLLDGLIPETEIWVLAGAENGHARLRLLGEESDGAHFLTLPELPVVFATAGAESRLPAPLPVRLLRQRSHHGRVDAILLDEAELRWLPPVLAGRPPAERAFLLPGKERYLLLAPGGLPGMIPFGVPLTRTGPGGLYLELGLAFYPPLPESARRRLFGLEEGGVVAVTHEGAYGFDSRHLTPAWSLWAGEPPPLREGLGPTGRQLLARVDEAVRQAEVEQIETSLLADSQPATQSRRGRPWLLEEAQRAELAGDLVRAAELLESAGELASAGRLYERAAQARR